MAGGKGKRAAFPDWSEHIVQGVARPHPLKDSFDNVASGLVGNKNGQDQAQDQPAALLPALPNPVNQ